MFPSTRTTFAQKPGYAKIRSSSLLRFPSPCYNWLRKDEGRIFRDRSGGKLTTWIPRGVCQLYPYFSLGKSRSHLWQGGRTLCWIVEVHTLAKTGHGRLDRNHRCRRNEMQIWGGGGEGGEAEDTSELHFKMLRVWKSTVPSILATISLYFCLFPFFCLTFFNIYLSTYYVRARFYNINIDDETDYFVVSWKNIWKKSSDIDFFFFFFDPSEKWEGNIPDLYIFTNNRKNVRFYHFSVQRTTFYYSE